STSPAASATCPRPSASPCTSRSSTTGTKSDGPHLMGTVRRDGRGPEDLRPVAFQRDFTEFAAGSVLVSIGRTRVLCTASVEADVPRWMRGTGKGWVTAEYSLLPGDTTEREAREVARGRQTSRRQVVQRRIGKAMLLVT